MRNDQGTARRIARVLLAASLAACSTAGDDGAGADSAAAAGDSAGAMPGMQHDTGTAGMAQGAASRPAARDSNQSFLRMMSDHHEGLVTMAGAARPRLTSATARKDAERLAAKQKEEQTRMKGMLQRSYSEQLTPTPPPGNRAMADSLRAGAAGAAYDSTFYRMVIDHHREGIAMIDRFMPALTGEVKRMAEQMSGEQTREIEEFERKAGPARGA